MRTVENVINLYAGAQLCLRSGVGGKRATELFRGNIVEAVYAALARPIEERPRLFISGELINGKLSWEKIAKLAERPDFPVLI